MKELLFVTPALPRPTGSGLQMRAFMFLTIEALLADPALQVRLATAAFTWVVAHGSR